MFTSNKIKKTFFLLIALCIFSASICSALPRASDYLGTCSAKASASSGGGVSVSVVIQSANSDRMTTLGVDKIAIQKSTDNGRTWSSVTTVYPSMSGSGTSYSGEQVVYTGTAGQMYRAVVTCIAENASGSDTRDVTTNSVTAKT